MARQKQDNMLETRASIYARLIERIGFPTFMCCALMWAIYMGYQDVKMIAMRQIDQTSELVAIQKQMLEKLSSIERDAVSAHRSLSSAP